MSKMSYELPNISRVSLAENLDGDRSKKAKKEWSECCNKLRRTRNKGRGVQVDPVPLGHLTLGDFHSLGGIKTD